MPNAFDQFDAPTAPANPFDQFDGAAPGGMSLKAVTGLQEKLPAQAIVLGADVVRAPATPVLDATAENLVGSLVRTGSAVPFIAGGLADRLGSSGDADFARFEQMQGLADRLGVDASGKSKAGAVAGNVLGIVPKLVAPEVLALDAVSHGTDLSARALQQNHDLATAYGLGGLGTAAGTAGVVMPASVPGNLLVRLLTGGGLTLGLDVGERSAEHALAPDVVAAPTTEDALTSGGIGAILAAALGHGAAPRLPNETLEADPAPLGLPQGADFAARAERAQPQAPGAGGPVHVDTTGAAATPEQGASAFAQAVQAAQAVPRAPGLGEPVVTVDPQGNAATTADQHAALQPQPPAVPDPLGLTERLRELIAADPRSAREGAPIPPKALPAPAIEVTRTGEARTTAQRNALLEQQRGRAEERAALGITPDIERTQGTRWSKQAQFAESEAERRQRLAELDNAIAAREAQNKPARGRNAQPDESVDDALTFLAKSGGLDRRTFVKEGLDPATARAPENLTRGGASRPLFRAQGAGGLTLDQAAERLWQHGYLDSQDNNAALDLILGGVNHGEPAYSIHRNAQDDLLALEQARRDADQHVTDDYSDIPFSRKPADTRQAAGMSRAEFLGSPRITPDSNAHELAPKALTTTAAAEAEPFMGRYKARFSPDGASVYDGDKVIASYNFGDTLAVAKPYRRQGIATELVAEWRRRYPAPATAKTRTKAAQRVQERAFDKLAGAPDDARFSFAGERARTADRGALQQAQAMEAMGRDSVPDRFGNQPGSPEDTHMATGWHRGVDGKWRFEIDDSQAKLHKDRIAVLDKGGIAPQTFESVAHQRQPDGSYDLDLIPHNPQRVGDIHHLRGIPADALDAILPKDVAARVRQGDGEDDLMGSELGDAKRIRGSFSFGGLNAMPLDLMLDHPALFKAYPELANVTVRVNPDMRGLASYSAKSNMIDVRPLREYQPKGDASLKSVLLHEIQHAIQNHEGFARGGSSAEARKLPEFEQALRQQMAERGGELPDWNEVKPTAPDEIKAAQQVYRRLAGEVEARNTQRRMNMDARERRAVPPSETADVPRHQQIVRFNADRANAEDVTDADRQAVERYNAILSKHIGAPVAFTPAAHVPEHTARTLAEVRQIFDVRPIVVRNETPDTLDINGVTVRDGVMLVNEDATSPALVVTGHELIHQMRRDAPDLYAELVADQRDNLRVHSYGAVLAERAKKLGEKPREMPHDEVQEELVADAAGDALGDPDFIERLAKTNPGLFRRFARYALDFLARVSKQLRSLGSSAFLGDVEAFRTKLADVLERYAQRQQGPARAPMGEGGEPVMARTEGDDQTRTPAFRKWFGESKVVDAEGRPLRVYHGTGNLEGMDQFKPELTGQGNDQIGSGFYFTTDPAEASAYTSSITANAGEGARKLGGDTSPGIAPVYLSIKNPIRVEGSNLRESGVHLTQKQVEAIIRRAPKIMDPDESPIGDWHDIWGAGGVKPWMIPDVAKHYVGENLLSLEGDFFRGDATAFRHALADVTGHDGVTFDFGGKQHWVAWFPEQIKSATGNAGTFDPENPSILFSRKPRGEETRTEAALPAASREPRFNRATELWTEQVGKPVFTALGKATKALVANDFLKRHGLNLAEDMPPAAREAWRQYRIDIAKAQQNVAAVGRAAANFTPAERSLLSDYIEREMAAGVRPPEHVVKTAQMMGAVLTRQSEELVRLGMLSPEAKARWEGRYLPRFYEKHVLAHPWDRNLRAVWRGIKGNHLKGRGLFETVAVKDVPKYQKLGWELRQPSGKSVDLAGLKPTQTVRMWRDFTPAERAKMGEVRDGLYRFARGYTDTQRDIALGRLFERIGSTVARDADPGGWVQVPDTSVPDTGVKRFGKLAGKWVPGDVLAELQAKAGPQSELAKLYLKALSLWKEGKTSLNPVTHVNNVVSNVVMADLAGLNVADPRTYGAYAAAFKHYKNKSPVWQEAQEAGLFGGEWFGNEIHQYLPIPAELKSAQSQGNGVAAFGRKALDLVSKGREAMGRAYQAEDQFFKFLLYLQGRSRGLDPDASVDWAERWVFDYSNAAPGVRKLKNSLIPFANYGAKAIPALAFAATHYPWRVAKWMALLGGLSLYSFLSVYGDDHAEGEATEGALLPDYLRGGSAFFGVPKALRMPWNDDEGQAVYVDISRFLPMGDLFDTDNQMGGLPLPAPFMPSNPLLTTAYAMLANKDSFTGREVTRETDSAGEAAAKRAAWLYRQMAPNNPLVPGTYNFNRLADATAAATGRQLGPYTGTDYNGSTIKPGRALAQTFGVKLRTVDLERERDKQLASLAHEVRDLRGEARQLLRNGTMPADAKARQIAKLREKIQARSDDMAKLRAMPIKEAAE